MIDPEDSISKKKLLKIVFPTWILAQNSVVRLIRIFSNFTIEDQVVI